MVVKVKVKFEKTRYVKKMINLKNINITWSKKCKILKKSYNLTES